MRVQNSLKNMIYGLSGQIISTVMGFIARTVFIGALGIEYLSVDGLFSNILTMLSLANLGFDTAVTYSLYKPLAEKDTVRIRALMSYYEKAYRLIGVVVLVAGAALLPFLPHLITGETGIRNLELIYGLFLLNSVLSYYFVYKQTILIADQRQYVISKTHSVFIILANLLQIILLLTLKAYIFILILQIVLRVLENIYIAHRADSLYPFLKHKDEASLSKADKRSLYESIYALMLYRISGVVISGTDNLVISKFVGILWVGLYSNYLLLVNTVDAFLGYIFHSLTASVGHVSATESAEKKYSVFCTIYFASFWLYGFCTVCLWTLLNPFITLWLGEKFLLSRFVIFAILLNFYTTGMQNASTTFRDTTGMFKVGKYRPIIAAGINISVSILLAGKMGIAGVLLGTVISRLCTYFWYDPYILYKVVFHKPVNRHFLKYVCYGALVACSAVICDSAGRALGCRAYADLAVRAALCVLVPNSLFFVLFRASAEFRYLWNVAKGIAGRKLLSGKELYS